VVKRGLISSTILSSLLLFVGCGGSDESALYNSDTYSVYGKAIDGPLYNVVVKAYDNNNNIVGQTYIRSTTKDTGDYLIAGMIESPAYVCVESLDEDKSYDLGLDGLINGGDDIEFTGKLCANVTNTLTNITPLTYLNSISSISLNLSTGYTTTTDMGDILKVANSVLLLKSLGMKNDEAYKAVALSINPDTNVTFKTLPKDSDDFNITVESIQASSDINISKDMLEVINNIANLFKKAYPDDVNISDINISKVKAITVVSQTISKKIEDSSDSNLTNIVIEASSLIDDTDDIATIIDDAGDNVDLIDIVDDLTKVDITSDYNISSAITVQIEENSSGIVLSNDTNIDQYTLELEKTQWYATYNEDFYNINEVDKDAHIHGDEYYSTYTGKGVKVAIIDNGFDTAHPEFQGRIRAKINCTGVGAADDVTYSSGDDYHGTATSGIIGAAKNDIGIRGIAPNSELILIKMPEYLTDSQTIDMFQKAVDAGADIISCSWGTYDVSDTVRDYINEISNTARDGKGVIVVFASGNDNKLMGNDESSIENVIGVSATDQNNYRTGYSNYGLDLDLVAPGGGQYSNEPGITTLDIQGDLGSSNDEYIRYNEIKDGTATSFIGTSASAPVVSGALALVLEANPNITRPEMQELLKSTSDKIGLSLPYLVDYEIVNSSTPTFYGTLGSDNSSSFDLNITSDDGTFSNSYTINVSGNNWSVTIPDTLKEGFYSSYLIYRNQILATDKEFEVNLNKTTITHSTRNDYYGYGKINLKNLIDSAK